VQQTDFWVLIPARRSSSRLPNKPLADIAGKPMVVRVAERAAQSGARRIAVATDDTEIAQTVRSAGFDAVMTSADHQSGTDRLAQACELLGATAEQVVVNLQGDEPLMPPDALGQIAAVLTRHAWASVATAVTPIHEREEFLNPNAVKAVLGHEGRALYFSRAPVPYLRTPALDQPGPLPTVPPAYRHLGLYGYRAGLLEAFVRWGPSALEQAEQLEQLRWLEHGHAIGAIVLKTPPPPGVDTPQDLERVRAAWNDLRL
jgi:3-deoxy-manno-octulosonate cytidylyltransferase (CMP-KDO synthetase)